MRVRGASARASPRACRTSPAGSEAPRAWGSIDDTAKQELPSVMGPPTSSTRFLCLSGHEARTRQYRSGAGGKGARRSCRERRWLLVRSQVIPGRGRSRSGFVQGLAPLFPGRSASRPPPGIFRPSVAGSSAACMMPGSIRSPRVNLISVLEHDSAVRQRGVRRHHRGPRPGKGTSVDGMPSVSSARSFPLRHGPRIRCSHAHAGSGDIACSRVKRNSVPSSHIRSGTTAMRRAGALPATPRRQPQRPGLQPVHLPRAGRHRRGRLEERLAQREPGRARVSRDATGLQCTGWNHPVRSSCAMPSASRRSVLTGAGLQADSRDAAGQAMHVLDGRSGIRRHLRSVHDPAIGAGRASRRDCHRHVRSGKDFHCRCVG